MIDKECLTTEWIKSVAQKTKYKDLNIIEKVIRVLSLLELLRSSGCPFCFKGGSALMLILGQSAHRLSIDVDIICPPGTDVEQYLQSIEEFGFTYKTLEERQQRGTNIPKSHSKLFYHIAYKAEDESMSYILLDVLYEDIHYHSTRLVDIDSPFVRQEGKPLKVEVPSAEDILGDKLTAFAPNTSGIPYIKGNRDRSLEIIKQLYDVGRLFDHVEDLSTVKASFKDIAVVELQYRHMPPDLNLIFNDIRDTSLCLATRGKAGKGNFDSLQSGIKKIGTLIYSGKYHIEQAIIDASRAAYLATCIEKDEPQLVKYSDEPSSVLDMELSPTVTNKLNKLKKILPEAFYYWAMTSRLLVE